MIIGRKEELATLASLNQSNESAFVAVYGRRRVGKTYLILTPNDYAQTLVQNTLTMNDLFQEK